MRKLYLSFLSLCFLSLALLSFPIKVSAEDDPTPADFLTCGDPYQQIQDDTTGTIQKCSINGRVLDESGNSIPADKEPKIYLHFEYYGSGGYQSGLKIPITPTAGGYEYCSIQNGTAYDTFKVFPRVTGISFGANGYEESGVYNISQNNACVTTGGSRVGNSPNLKVSDGSNPIPTETWYWIYDANGCVKDPDTTLVESLQGTDEIRGPYPSQSDCQNATAGIDQEENLPTPTPTPLPPPCARVIDDTKGCTAIDSALSSIETDPQGLIKTLFIIMLSLSGGIALLMLIYSGYQILTSRGDAEKVKVARERITSVVIGLLFMIFAVVIFEVIGVDILHLPGFER